jgi:hypothetical protein
MSLRAEAGTRALKSPSVEMLAHPGVERSASMPARPHASGGGSWKGSAARSGGRQEEEAEVLAGTRKEPVAARWRARRRRTDWTAKSQREASSEGSGVARKGRSAVKFSGHCGGVGWEWREVGRKQTVRRNRRWRRRRNMEEESGGWRFGKEIQQKAR